MVTTGMVYDFIDSFAPFSTQMSFDNAGLLIGSRERPVERVLCCLDATASMARQASRDDCQLVVSHHPVIFTPLSSISDTSAEYALIRAGVDVICAHTNLDLPEWGVNSCLADALGFEGFARPVWMECGVFGELPEPVDVHSLASRVCKSLDCAGVAVVDGGRPIRRVALLGGQCGDELTAMFGRIDAFITGEAKHHLLVAAKEFGCTLILAGHHRTEAVVVKPLAERIAAHFGQIEVICGEQLPPESIISNR